MINQIKQFSKTVLHYCENNRFICYKCPKCGLLSYGLLTSYHQISHGEQEIFYNPLPQLNKEN